MATSLRRGDGTYVHPTPRDQSPVPAELTAARRREQRAARRRWILAAVRAANPRRCRTVELVQPVRFAEDPSDARTHDLADRMIRRMYGVRANEAPSIMRGLWYWQARACGWEPLEGVDDDGLPAEPVAEWFFAWWVKLPADVRASLRIEHGFSGQCRRAERLGGQRLNFALAGSLKWQRMTNAASAQS